MHARSPVRKMRSTKASCLFPPHLPALPAFLLSRFPVLFAAPPPGKNAQRHLFARVGPVPRCRKFLRYSRGPFIPCPAVTVATNTPNAECTESISANATWNDVPRSMHAKMCHRNYKESRRLLALLRSHRCSLGSRMPQIVPAPRLAPERPINAAARPHPFAMKRRKHRKYGRSSKCATEAPAYAV